MSAPALRSVGGVRAIKATGDLSAAERVAVILSLMEPDAARAVAADWPPARLDAVVAAYENLGTLPRPVVLELIATFVAELSGPGPSVRGGHGAASALASALKTETDEMPATEEDALDANAPSDRVWSYVTRMEAERLANLLSRERPAAIATVIARMTDAQGGALMAALGEDVAVAVALHVASGRPPTPRIAEAVAAQLRDQVTAPPAPAETASDPAPTLTALLNRCPQSRQDATLAALAGSSVLQPDLATRVEAGLLRFATLAERLPRTIAPVLFREADQKTLDAALRHAGETAPETVEYLYASISQRLAEQIRERVAALAIPSPEEGEAAQAAVIGTLMEWAAEGRFALNEPPSGDE